jgi:DNA-binding XRE family transcriptional regulator
VKIASKYPGTITHGELIGSTINGNSEFRGEWERLAPARRLAAEVVRFRAANAMSQTGLARRLGVSQARVATIELAEHNPSIDTIAKIVAEIGIEFCLDFVPAGRTSKLTTKAARDQQEHTAALDGVKVHTAAA